MKIKNRIFAIEAAPEAIPPKPKTAAIIATIKKMTVQRSIIVDFKFIIWLCNPAFPNKILCQNPDYMKKLPKK